MEESSDRRSDKDLMRAQRGRFHAGRGAKTSATLWSRYLHFIAKGPRTQRRTDTHLIIAETEKKRPGEVGKGMERVAEVDGQP